jgi:hypothetical protein
MKLMKGHEDSDPQAINHEAARAASGAALARTRGNPSSARQAFMPFMAFTVNAS